MKESAGRGHSARPWRLLAGLLAGVLITAALLLGALRFALALVPENATRLQHWVEQQTRLRVEFAGIDARLRWFGPEIVLRDVRVLDENRTEALFEAREGAPSMCTAMARRPESFQSVSVISRPDGCSQVTSLACGPRPR